MAFFFFVVERIGVCLRLFICLHSRIYEAERCVRIEVYFYSFGLGDVQDQGAHIWRKPHMKEELWL